MIATVQTSKDIAHSLTYGQNPAKGGSIILSNLTDEGCSPKQQANDWEALCKSFKVKCYNIVISFSDSDTKVIRRMEPHERANKERQIVKAFMDELNARGNDVYDCPFVIAHHGNTDNEHFHISILSTTIDGTRINDSFIKKNACRSAAAVSIKFGLDGAVKAIENERNHQKAKQRRKSLGDSMTSENMSRKKRTYTRVNKDSENLKYRAARIKLAEKRKAMCKFNIETIAKTADSSNFVQKLKAEGLVLHYDPKGGLYVEMHDNAENKDYTYFLEGQLGIDTNILPQIDVKSITKPRTSGSQKELPVKEKKDTVTYISNDRQQKNSSHSNGMPNLNSHATYPVCGQSQLQGDRNPDGSISKDRDDLDEEWKRKNGYHR